ncbi:MAG TPA: DUF3352 domain-containing protein [Pyrinomonadaceae bacterium]|nr:DUF3352 domain-containing protein [Pyrinomonadaceae bacterium]
MRPKKISRRLTPLVLACVLLASFPHAPASAQRRRQPAQTIARPAATAPAPRAETETQPANADAQPANAQRRNEPDRSIEEMLSADAYSVYAEWRRLGALAQMEEIKTGVAALQLFGDETKPLTDLVGFVGENSEMLIESRAVLVSMPTRGGLPQALFALELPSPEAAIAFEPKMRRLFGQQAKAYRDLVGDTQAAPPAPRRAGRQAGRERPEPRKADASTFAFRRAGRWLLAADSPFTLKRLRGDEGASALSQDVRFQSARTRFSSDAFFVYVDTTLAQQGWALQMQKDQEARDAAAAKEMAEEQKRGVAVGKVEDGTTTTVQTPVVIEQPAPTTADAPSAPEASPSVTPTPPAEESAAPPVSESEGKKDEEGEGELSAVAEVRAPTPEQMAAAQLGGVLRGLWGGIPRIPGAVALGVGLGGGNLAVRVAVENPSDGTINVIPFLPNIISGAPVTAEASEVAPADADIFFSTSLDWAQIYTSTLGTASLSPSYNVTANMIGGGGEDESGGAASSEKPPTPDETIALIEKLFRFKFKEDLLPSLGNEVAISMPLDIFGGGLVGPSRRSAEKKEQKDSEPGFVFIISLNNPEKIREILPRVLAALSFSMPDAGGGASERREGFEIRAEGGVAYAIINNFLVASTEVKAVRHVVDSFAARKTLATSNAYRDSTEWQAKQKLVQAYVSEALMRGATEDTKKRSGGSTDPVVRALLTQLDVPPLPASYEATNEGDVLVHELRLPMGMLKAYATAIMISAKDAPVTTGEAMAVYALSRIGGAQEEFKTDKKKERFGTLDELIAEGILEKDFLQHLEYKIELSVSGEKYEVTATPKNYGKTGRRSFFVDEGGTVRGADHKGRPATAADPPVN